MTPRSTDRVADRTAQTLRAAQRVVEQTDLLLRS